MSTTTTSITVATTSVNPDGTTTTTDVTIGVPSASSPPAAPGVAIASAQAPLKVEVAYWSIRGLGAPLRMLCHYAGDRCDATYTNYFVTAKEGGGWDTSSWFDGPKQTILAANPLANLPYVIADGSTVTQSNACLTMVGKKLGLLGANDVEVSETEQLLCQVMDMRNTACGQFYGGSDLPGELEAAKGQYAKFEAWLNHKGAKFKFLVGQGPLAADFHLWEMVDQHEMLAKDLNLPSPVAGFPKVSQLYKDLRALPEMQGYFAGEHYALPCNNRMAKWGANGVVDGKPV